MPSHMHAEAMLEYEPLIGRQALNRTEQGMGLIPFLYGKCRAMVVVLPLYCPSKHEVQGSVFKYAIR